MTATATATTAFHVTLNVANLAQSTHFYRTLLGLEPLQAQANGVRFILEEPPVIIDLAPATQVPGGSLNHVGLRLPSSAALVEVQHRLESAGIATQRQDGVECCYARQTKFWITDPDRNLWELYVLEEDIDHSGFEDAPHRPAAVVPATIWEHRITEPVPTRIPHDDATVDEVRFEGTFNLHLEALRPAALLAEVMRVLRPGGQVAIHGMGGNQAVGSPTLPGLAALVQRVPAIAEVIDLLRQTGFTGIYCDQLKRITCLDVGGLEVCEMKLLARRPPEPAAADPRRVMYKGPLAEVRDGTTVFPRGVIVTVPAACAEALQHGPAAGQFAFLPAR